jgi:hypothetical protein
MSQNHYYFTFQTQIDVYDEDPDIAYDKALEILDDMNTLDFDCVDESCYEADDDGKEILE